MAKLPPIEREDIETWARKNPSPHIMTQLVRRLLWASVPTLRIDPRPVGAWGDAVVVVEQGDRRVPKGRSIWAFDARRWASLEDEHVAEGTSYVIVEPTRSGDPRAPHGNARVIDADELGQWLSACPAVAAWFGVQGLQRPAGDVLDVESYLERWSRKTRPMLPPDLVLQGREAEVERLSQWIAPKAERLPGPMNVYAETAEEARVFATSVVAKHEHASARALVIRSSVAWREWSQDARSLILIPGFEEPLREPVGEGPLVVVSHTLGERRRGGPGEARIELSEPIPWRTVAERLVHMGLSEPRAKKLAEESRGYLGPLARLLGSADAPKWVSEGEPRDLAIMLLLRAWAHHNEGDGKAIAALGGDPQRLDETCLRLSQIADAPIDRDEHGAWRWRSPADAWKGLDHLLSSTLLERFVTVAIDILEEEDPAFELPRDERFIAPVYGKVLQRSKALRAGIAESLARLANAVDDGRLVGVGAGRVGWRVLDAVLGEPWQRWASLGELLPVLAEVEPRTFLDQVEASMRAEHGIIELFEQETPQGSPHIALLQALAVLAWDPKTMARVVDVLAMLAANDPAREDSKGRWANRPLESLQGIFHFFAPQTAADDDARLSALRRVIERQPEVGWSLLLALVRQLDGGIVPQHSRPRLCSEAPANPKSVPGAILEARVRQLEGLVFELAGTSPQRWADLFEKNVVRRLDEDELDRRMDLLVELRPRDDEDRLWSVVRDDLYEQYFFGRDDPSRLARLRRIHDAFEPKDLVRKHAWLLAGGIRLPEPMPRDPVGHTALAQERRDAALEEILAEPNGHELLVQLVDRLGSKLQALGYTLARVSMAPRFEARILGGDEAGPLRVLAPYLALGAYYRRSQDSSWLHALLERWCSQGRAEEALTVLLGLWGEPKVWDLVDQLGDLIRQQYWARCPRVGEHEGDQWQRAVENLLEAGNLSTALQAAAAASRHQDVSQATLFALLEAVARSPRILRSDDELRPEYDVEEVFLALDRHYDKQPSEAGLARLATLEIRFIDILEDSRTRPIRHLPNVLEHSPSDFALIVGWQYGNGDEGTRESGGDEPSTKLTLDEDARDRRAIEALAEAFNEADSARQLAVAAGFARSMLPDFKNPAFFWSRIAEEIRSGASPGTLVSILAEAAKQYPHNPAFFAQPSVEGVASPSPPDPADVQRAQASYRILTSWKTYPGHDQSDPAKTEQTLVGWSRAVLLALEEHGVGARAEDELAQVLARPERAVDGHWPCLAARELLESGTHPRFAQELFMAKRYPRGIGMVPSPGASKQRDVARGFERTAEALRKDYPRTAGLLDGLAQSYQEDTERRDRRARAERIEDGFLERRVLDASADPVDVLQPIPPLHRIELHAVGPASDLSIDLAPRINLVVGDNGLGKTFLLDVLWWSLTGSWPGTDRMAWPSEADRSHEPTIRLVDGAGAKAIATFDLRGEHWVRGGTWPHSLAPVLYVRVDGGISIWDPLRNDVYGAENRRALPAFHLDATQLERGLHERPHTTYCKGLIADWEQWRHDDPALFAHFFEVVRTLFGEAGPEVEVLGPGPAVQLSKFDVTLVPTLALPYGQVPIVHLSAGMKRILGVAYALVWAWSSHRQAAKFEDRAPAEHLVVLFDEVESHLHPRWQRSLLPALLRGIESLADQLSIQLVVTTHSPLVMASLETSFSEPRDQLFHLELVDGRVEMDRLPWASHGEVGNWLVSSVFGLTQPSSIPAERAIERARRLIRASTPPHPDEIAAVMSALDEAEVPETHEVRSRLRRMLGEAAQ